MKTFQIPLFFLIITLKVHTNYSECEIIASLEDLSAGDIFKELESKTLEFNSKTGFLVSDSEPSAVFEKPYDSEIGAITAKELKNDKKGQTTAKEDVENLEEDGVSSESEDEGENEERENEKKPEMIIHGFHCEGEDLQNCLNFLGAMRNDIKDDKEYVKCYKVLEDREKCEPKEIFVFFRLHNDLTYKVLMENNYDFVISYLTSLLQNADKLLDNNVMPEINDSPFLNWLNNSGYFYNKYDKIVVIPTRISIARKESEIQKSDLEKLGKQFFIFMKNIFAPTDNCLKIVDQYKELMVSNSSIHAALINDDSFPSVYIHTLNAAKLVYNGNEKLAHKLITFLIIFAFCSDNVVYDKNMFKSISELFIDLTQKDIFFSKREDKKNFKQYFVDGKKDTGSVASIADIKEWLNYLYGGDSDLTIEDEVAFELRIKDNMSVIDGDAETKALYDKMKERHEEMKKALVGNKEKKERILGGVNWKEFFNPNEQIESKLFF